MHCMISQTIDIFSCLDIDMIYRYRNVINQDREVLKVSFQ